MIEFRAASSVDIPALRPSMTKRQLKNLLYQLSAGLSWSLWDGEECCAFAGAVPVANANAVEAWFNVSPNLTVRQGARVVRVLMRRLTGIAPEKVILLLVHDGHQPGVRLANIAGFERTEFTIGESSFRYWRLTPPPLKARLCCRKQELLIMVDTIVGLFNKPKVTGPSAGEKAAQNDRKTAALREDGESGQQAALATRASSLRRQLSYQDKRKKNQLG